MQGFNWLCNLRRGVSWLWRILNMSRNHNFEFCSLWFMQHLILFSSSFCRMSEDASVGASSSTVKAGDDPEATIEINIKTLDSQVHKLRVKKNVCFAPPWQFAIMSLCVCWVLLAWRDTRNAIECQFLIVRTTRWILPYTCFETI